MNQINPSGLSYRPPHLLLPHPPGPCRSYHDDHLRTGREGLLDRLFAIGCEDDHTVVTLDALEKMRRFCVRITVVGIINFRALAKQRISFIEKQNRATGFRFIKYIVQIFLRLADVLGHHRRHIHLEQIYFQCFGQHLSGLPSAERRGP